MPLICEISFVISDRKFKDWKISCKNSSIMWDCQTWIFFKRKVVCFQIAFLNLYSFFLFNYDRKYSRVYSLISTARRKLPVINFREMPSCNWIGQFYGEKRWHPAHAARLSRRPRILGLAWTRSFIGGRGRGSNSLTRDHDQLPPRQLDNYCCRFTRAMCSTRCQRVSFIHTFSPS